MYTPPAGRFAPSPTGEFHIGNLRTAMLAWLYARSTGRSFYLRMEDLDRVRAGSEDLQLRDLAEVGITFDDAVLRQSKHLARYAEALTRLTDAGLTYECFCSRKDVAQAIAQSASAPHGAAAFYPGTCRDLNREERAARRAETGRDPAIRLKSGIEEFTVTDRLHGRTTTPVDDFIVQRNDGVFAYNLVSVVDDQFMGVDQVVRGDDLLDSTGRQAYLATLLGAPIPEYVHVPLVLNAEGRRLAKRDGAVTLREIGAERAVGLCLESVGLPPSLTEALEAFTGEIPRDPWIFRPEAEPGH